MDGTVALEIVTRGYRSMALELHPDRGGSHEGMVALTRPKEWLAGTIGRARDRGYVVATSAGDGKPVSYALTESGRRAAPLAGQAW